MFSIVFPKSASEIKKEGRILRHMVAEYIPGVLEGKYLIAFLRRTDDLATPLVTLMLKDGKVLQARGLDNRTPTPEEQEFLDQYQAGHKAA